MLHDWGDADACALLRRARDALRPGGTVAVVEMVLDDVQPSGGLCDLHLRVVTGGRERTLVDFTTLFANAGLRLTSDIRVGSFLHVLVGAAP